MESIGGFRSLEYDPEATFRSSIGINGTVGWTTHTAKTSHPDDDHGLVELNVAFPQLEQDNKFLQSVYGWAALQWQGWARGEIFIHPETAGPFVLHAEGILEFWIDETHYFGGDMYEFGRAPVTLRLEPGSHRIDIRLVRDVRAFGAVGSPTIDVKVRLQRSRAGLELLYGYSQNVLMSEAVGGTFGPLASPYASITMRNDAERDIYVHSIEGMEEKCVIEMMSKEPTKLVPGQTRPIGFKIACTPSYGKRLHFKIQYTIDGIAGMHTKSTSTWPKVLKTMTEPHRVTFMHPGGMVSYAILRPPSANCSKDSRASLPVVVVLHGAGLEADSAEVRHAFDELPDIPAWVLFPTGVTPWSGDDWHIWGWADVEAAIAMIPTWIEQVGWDGPAVDTSKLLLAGHSNGGQGTWYGLTHHFDRIIAAAPLSGYSSIQNYVPYTFWHTADPAKMAIIHASLNSYRHELLLENAKGIPVLQQHGDADDNVPVYHSRLMGQRIQEAGADSEYFEFEGKPHYWDGIMTTQPMKDFVNEHLRQSQAASRSPRLSSFSMVVANPAETGLKFGIKVVHTRDPGRLGRIDLTYDQLSGRCSFRTSNILVWIMPQTFRECRLVSIDGQEVDLAAQRSEQTVWLHDGKHWKADDSIGSAAAGSPMRDQSQLGHLDAILRTNGPFTIVQHTPETSHVALQVSRNLYQYFGADTHITSDYDAALDSQGNIITLSTAPSLPVCNLDVYPISISDAQITINLNPPHAKFYTEVDDHGLGAIFIRPLPNGRLELVIWGKDKRSLRIAARLAPLMTGSGVPDFVVVDERVLYQGVGAARAMGFLDAWWKVTGGSVLE